MFYVLRFKTYEQNKTLEVLVQQLVKFTSFLTTRKVSSPEDRCALIL